MTEYGWFIVNMTTLGIYFDGEQQDQLWDSDGFFPWVSPISVRACSMSFDRNVPCPLWKVDRHKPEKS